jgi:hypothetical protein
MSPNFVEKLTRGMESVPFMKYDQDHTSDQRIQIVSENYSEFLVSKVHGTKRYASARDITPSEAKLLCLMNELLKMYAELFEKGLDIKVRLVDQRQEVKDRIQDGGYHLHNDQSALCCLWPGEQEIENRVSHLDSPVYMIVATYVLSNIKVANTKVTWICEDGTGKNL